MLSKNIILTGFMGTGKSVVGRILAEKTGLKFVDTDELIVAKVGKSISNIFNEDGERFFRDIEAKVISEVCRKKGQIISTGGGAVTMDGNISTMKDAGLLVSLTASKDAILYRIEQGDHRPLMDAGDRKKKISTMLEQRMKYYSKADITIDTTGITPEAVAEKIMQLTSGPKG